MPPLWLIVDGDATATDLELDLAIVFSLVEPQLLSQMSADQKLLICKSQDLQSQEPARLVQVLQTENPVLLPLTWNLPEPILAQIGSEQPAWLNLWFICQDPHLWLQHLHSLGYEAGLGNYWLPIVQTGKGPLYGEVIGPDPNLISMPESGTPISGCVQPIHLDDRYRQPLYQAGFTLLQSLQAPPSTYFLQFGWQEDTLQLEKLWPFPIRPSFASLAVQDPDLLTCYLRTRTGQAITDLLISGTVPHYLPVFAD